ncbi:MAG TPA: DMT family transporter [Candidatus Saccharimonadales bacterium]|nr:DMT family transporter [Candidatus Saccharimonadales bacterium]
MHTDFLAIVFGLLAGFGWGISGFFDAKASRTAGPLLASLLINCLVAVGYALLYLLFWRNGHHVQATGVYYATASGVVITLGALSYFKGLALGPVALVSPLSAAYPLVTTIIAFAIFGARLSGLQILAIYMIMAGVMAASGLLTARGIATRKLQKGPLLALGTAICWGLGYAFAAQAITRLGWQLASLLEFGAMAVAFGVFIPMVKATEVITLKHVVQGCKNRFILLSGGISLGAATLLNVGLSRENSSGAIVAALSACYPVLTVLLARRSFDEAVALVPFIGAFVSIGGVILLSLAH